MKTAAFLTVAVAFVVVSVLLGWLLSRDDHTESGIGQQPGSHAPLSSSGRGTRSAGAEFRDGLAPKADARPSPPEPYHQPRSERARGGEQGWLGGPFSDVGTAARLASYDDAFLDTKEGLWWATIGLWSSEEFLALSQDEAHELLGLDDHLGFRGPGTLQELVGPLPTQEDCGLAYAFQDVKEAHRKVVAFDVAIVELGGIPAPMRTKEVKAEIERLIPLRDAAMEDLLGRCEDATGKQWKIWHKLYLRWSRNTEGHGAPGARNGARR